MGNIIDKLKMKLGISKDEGNIRIEEESLVEKKNETIDKQKEYISPYYIINDDNTVIRVHKGKETVKGNLDDVDIYELRLYPVYNSKDELIDPVEVKLGNEYITISQNFTRFTYPIGSIVRDICNKYQLKYIHKRNVSGHIGYTAEIARVAAPENLRDNIIQELSSKCGASRDINIIIGDTCKSLYDLNKKKLHYASHIVIDGINYNIEGDIEFNKYADKLENKSDYIEFINTNIDSRLQNKLIKLVRKEDSIMVTIKTDNIRNYYTYATEYSILDD